MLFAGFLLILLVSLHLSWEASRLEAETRTLAEDVALIRAHLVAHGGYPTTTPRCGRCRRHRLRGALVIDDRRVLIILPAWNEEEGLPSVLAEIQRQLPYVDTLVVDDGSTDNTSAVALAAGSAVARLPFNLGVGGAMRCGYRYASCTATTWRSRSTPTASTTRRTCRPCWPSWTRPTW